MAVMIGLAAAGLASGVLGSLSASADAKRQAEMQYRMAQYQQKRATDAANLKRAFNLRQQYEQRQALFDATYKEYYFNTGQAQDAYTQQVKQASNAYMKTRGALTAQLSRNGMSTHHGSGRALAYSAMRQASQQMQGASQNLATTRMQLRDRMETKLSTKVNAEAPSLFIPGTGPQTASSMSQTLGAMSAGLGGLQSGLALYDSFQRYNPPTAPAAGGGADFVGPPNPYTNANSGAFIFAQ